MANKKFKIKNSVSKRFKVTKTGKVLHGHQNMSHLKSKMSKSRKRRLRIPGQIEGTFGKKIKMMLGVSTK